MDMTQNEPAYGPTPATTPRSVIADRIAAGLLWILQVLFAGLGVIWALLLTLNTLNCVSSDPHDQYTLCGSSNWLAVGIVGAVVVGLVGTILSAVLITRNATAGRALWPVALAALPVQALISFGVASLGFLAGPI